MSDFVVEMRDISKRYPGVLALDQVSLQVRQGEVHALVGENGAGKSTLMKILAGAQEQDSGEVFILGKKIEKADPLLIRNLGVSMIYQELNLLPAMTVLENFYLGREPVAKFGFLESRLMAGQAQSFFQKLGINLDLKKKIRNLGIAQQQMIEIAKAVSFDAKIIIMDEPTAALTEREIRNLFSLIRSLQEKGVSIIYISHRLEEIFEITQNVTVMRDGKWIATKKTGDTNREELIKLMVGRELKEEFPKEEIPAGELVFSVKGVCSKKLLNIDFEVRKGEIVGLYGLVGSGRTELARAIFGADPFEKGEIFLDGTACRIRSPQDAIGYGIGLVTEDRKAEGLVLGMRVRENMTLASLKKFFLSSKEETALSSKLVVDLKIKTTSVEERIANLSGGNQQKVVLAKWILTNSKFMIFDEPTRGIDVGGKVEIYQLMNRMAKDGKGLLMISSELPEILGMSDRILVMHEGKITGAFSRKEATQEKILHLATGGE